MRYLCDVCGYVYDELNGDPEAEVAAGTSWEGLPADWVCPDCGAPRSEFQVVE